MTIYKPTVSEIASAAGVSTATVDRVLNERGGVREKTIGKVMEAMRLLETRRDTAVVAPADRVVDFILPANAGPSTELLGQSAGEAGSLRGVNVRVSFVERMSPVALADALRGCAEAGSSGVAFQALDHQFVREAVEVLIARGLPVVTLCSDIGGTDRAAYVGMDNRSAGRTAGYLMGRLCRKPGKVVVVWGGQLYRGHEEREFGFRSVLRADFPQLDIVDVITGNDDAQENYARLSGLLARQHDLAGVYCIGGGLDGVIKALQEAPRDPERVVIGHNLSASTKSYLLSGEMDVVLHQDMSRVARVGLEWVLSPKGGAPSTDIPVEIIVRENVAR